MKILNIFKKETKKTVATSTRTLDKNQLSKVIGGTDAVDTTTPVTQEKKGLNAVNVKLG